MTSCGCMCRGALAFMLAELPIAEGIPLSVDAPKTRFVYPGHIPMTSSNIIQEVIEYMCEANWMSPFAIDCVSNFIIACFGVMIVIMIGCLWLTYYLSLIHI